MFVGHLQHNTSSFFFLSTENVYSHFPGKSFRVTFWRKISFTQYLTNACFLEASEKRSSRSAFAEFFSASLIKLTKGNRHRLQRKPRPFSWESRSYLYLRRARLLPRGSSQSCHGECCGQSYRETPAASRHRL